MENQIYKIANDIVNEYEQKGISGEELISYLNASTKNFKDFVARVKNGVQGADENVIAEICKDVIRDRYALIKDIN